MSNYRLANTTAQWFQDNFPGADLNLTAATAVLCLHTTETTNWPDYEGGATAPNYTTKPDFVRRRLLWRAHFPDEKSSRSLRNSSGGVETNTMNVVQVELIGTCDPQHRLTWNGLRAGIDYIFWPEAADWALKALAKFVADLHKRHGLQLTAPAFLPYPASINGDRFTFEQWHNFTGVCGHQHVPENVHGDPGNIDITKVLAMATELVTPKSLRVVAANMRHDRPPVPERVAKLANLKPDIVFTSEAYNIHPQMEHAFPKHQIVQGGGSKGHREVQVLVGPSVKILDSGMWQATKKTPGHGGVGNGRWVAWAKAEWQGHRFLLVGWHGNAVIQSKAGRPLRKLARTVEYVKEMRLLEAFCREQGKGCDLIIGGDGNWRQGRFWFFSPDALFRRLGLKAVSVGVDRLAYPATLDLDDHFTIKAPGADHPWIIADLARP